MDLTLTAETGRIAGSRSSSRLRADGQVPGVVYGLGRDAVSVSVPWPDLRRALSTDAGTNALITIDVDGQKDLAIVKDLQRHPVKRNVLHIDFLRVDPDALVAIDVPIILVGEAKQVESRRGIVDQPLKTLAVKAKPADIPSQLEAEISDLDIGDSVTVGDLVLPGRRHHRRRARDPGRPRRGHPLQRAARPRRHHRRPRGRRRRRRGRRPGRRCRRGSGRGRRRVGGVRLPGRQAPQGHPCRLAGRRPGQPRQGVRRDPSQRGLRGRRPPGPPSRRPPEGGQGARPRRRGAHRRPAGRPGRAHDLHEPLR